MTDLPDVLLRFKTGLLQSSDSRYMQGFRASGHARLLSDPAYFDRLARWNSDIFQTCRATNRVVLDYGSSFGLTVFFMAAFGARKAIGIEIDQEKVDFANFLKDRYFSGLDIEFICASDLKNIVPGSVDVILFMNVLSHVKLPIHTLTQTTKSLCYAGRILIQDNNNSLSPLVRVRNRRFWKGGDRGWRARRKQIIRNVWRGELDNRDVERWASLTRGLAKEDLDLLFRSRSAEEVETYLSERSQLVPIYNIEREIVDERMLNPYVYAKVLEDLGFECIRLRPRYFNLPAWAFPIWTVACRFPGVLLRILPAFELSGEKRRV